MVEMQAVQFIFFHFRHSELDYNFSVLIGRDYSPLERINIQKEVYLRGNGRLIR